MAKKVIVPSGEAVSFKTAFSEANSRKHFFLVNGKRIQNYTGYPGNMDYCIKQFNNAQTVYGPIEFKTAKRLAAEKWDIMGGIEKLTIESYAKFKKERK